MFLNGREARGKVVYEGVAEHPRPSRPARRLPKWGNCSIGDVVLKCPLEDAVCVSKVAVGCFSGFFVWHVWHRPGACARGIKIKPP
ncbi:Putative protein [Zobellia galactanivorans]|uniref:Uncharacterized protein n=1 Tax=Zobellia galactanivorans (strain DSM 12802 / CCUG 47099 / CIP 106680 / NCIMB 13871 / Dsij) TaxID=63186 RepID=G0L8E5_ZOBGA|nr:Putative protein [Zobellia galactanivorans]